MVPRTLYTLVLPGGRTLSLGERTLLMGVINVTPDSFADGGAHHDPEWALDRALALEAEGADILDIGGESTRPGAMALAAADERGRVMPVLDRLAGRVTVPVSVDTYKAEIAREAVDRGATIINDVSSLRYEPALAAVAAETGAALVLMHNRGRSREMYRQAAYDDVAADVSRELAETVRVATEAGVDRERIVVDPGLGFAKRGVETFAMLGRLEMLTRLDRPILVGPSRKSFLQEAIGPCPPDAREWGTAAAVTAAILGGAHIVRVHGVRAMRDVTRVADGIRAHREDAPVAAEPYGVHP
jgi:dihydropteroate synthase